MAKPPAGSSLLFGALADSGQIKQGKNGSHRMALNGVNEIDWFTDRPNRVEGTWKPKKLLREWDKYFASSEPNAQATVEVGEDREILTFEMFKPKMKSDKIIFNIKPLSESGEDRITGVSGRVMDDISLFIDNTNSGKPSCFPDCENADLQGFDMTGQELAINFESADLSDTNLSHTTFYVDLNEAVLTGANLTGATLNGVYLVEADLTNANLDGAFLQGATLSYADLNNAELKNAALNASVLSNADLTGANLNGALLTNAEWYQTTCPDGTMNKGFSPCTQEQLNLA